MHCSSISVNFSFGLDLCSVGADHSLFIYRLGYIIMSLLLYMDDIILTGNQPSQLSSTVHTFGKEFELSDLGPLSYFLGLEAKFSPTGLRLSQLKYTVDLLKKFFMSECKPCSTQVCAKKQLSANDGSPL